MKKVLNAKVVSSLYNLLDITKDDVISTKHSHTQEGKEKFWFVLAGFVSKDNKTLTINITLYGDGGLVATLNERHIEDDIKSYDVYAYLNTVDDIKTMINSRAEFKPKLNLKNELKLA